MNLLEFYNNDLETYVGNDGTDKGNLHDYIGTYYTNEFVNRDKPINLLEIGVHRGGSIKLWLDWFINGDIYGIDVSNGVNRDVSRAKLLFKDAYDPSTVSEFEDNFFDYIIDDGPHSLESQIEVISLWVSKLKPNGKLIIEDIQSTDWIQHLEDECKNHNVTWKVFDTRASKERYDDIIFEVTKQ